MSLFALFTVPVLFFSFFSIQYTRLTTYAKPKFKHVYSVSVKKPTSTPTATPTATLPLSLHSSGQARQTQKKILKKQIAPIASENQDVKSYIMKAVNEYRTSQGLSRVETDSNTCSFARLRAQEISQNFSHVGFRERIDNKTLPYPSYKTVTENIAQTSDYKRVVANWINSPGHAENMRKDTPFVCVEQQGSYYAYEGLRL